MPTEIKGNHNIIAGQVNLHECAEAGHLRTRLVTPGIRAKRALACTMMALAAGTGCTVVGLCLDTVAYITTALFLPVPVSLMLGG